jgi:hypothetical protein
VDERLLYDTFSAFGIMATTAKVSRHLLVLPSRTSLNTTTTDCSRPSERCVKGLWLRFLHRFRGVRRCTRIDERAVPHEQADHLPVRVQEGRQGRAARHRGRTHARRSGTQEQRASRFRPAAACACCLWCSTHGPWAAWVCWATCGLSTGSVRGCTCAAASSAWLCAAADDHARNGPADGDGRPTHGTPDGDAAHDGHAWDGSAYGHAWYATATDGNARNAAHGHASSTRQHADVQSWHGLPTSASWLWAAWDAGHGPSPGDAISMIVVC